VLRTAASAASVRMRLESRDAGADRAVWRETVDNARVASRVVDRAQPAASWERIGDGGDNSGHDPQQQEGGNEAGHERQHAAYAHRPRAYL
jgi:hypothetical protein